MTEGIAVPAASELVLASAVLALGSWVQGSVGFGLALISAPLLLLIHPGLVPGPIICASLVLTLLMALREHRAVDASGMGWAIVGRVPGSLAGASAVALLPEAWMAVVFAALVLLGVALSASGRRLAITRGSLVGTGALSGLMGTATSIGGPPIALLYQDAPGPRLRGTLAGFFVVGSLLSLVALAAFGRFGPRELAWSTGLVPGVLVGFGLSTRTTHVFDRGYTRPAVLLLSAVSALAVIARTAL